MLRVIRTTIHVLLTRNTGLDPVFILTQGSHRENRILIASVLRRADGKPLRVSALH